MAPDGAATSAACRRFADALPKKLLDAKRARVDDEPRRRIFGWASQGHDLIVAQCGVQLSGEAISRTAPLVNVNGVAWHQDTARESLRVVWTTPKTLIPVALVVPKSHDGHGGFLALLAPAVKAMQAG